MRVPFLLPAAVAAALLVALPATGHAQLGRLMKKAKDTATQRAAETAGDQVSAAVPPRKVQSIAPLTLQQLRQVKAGLRAELAKAPTARREAEAQQRRNEALRRRYDADAAAYRRRREQYDTCATRFRARETADAAPAERRMAARQRAAEAAAPTEAEMRALQPQLEAAAQRLAAGRGTAEDEALMRRFSGQFAGVQQAMAGVQADQERLVEQARTADSRLLATCGAEPQPPRSPPGLDASPETIMQQAGAEAAEMPLTLYAQIRETVGLFSEVEVETGGGLSATEVEEINAELTELRDLRREMARAGVHF